MHVQARRASVALLGMAALGIALALPRVPQDPEYHAFADGRAFFGLPNLLNVASNLPFLGVGLWGLFYVGRADGRRSFRSLRERLFHAVLFAAIFLIGLGSAYYHWNPTTATLFWDRLPMTLMFTAFLGITAYERIGPRAGTWLFGPLLAAGVWSIVHWRLTEASGLGDLRFYGLLQCFTMLAVPLLVILFPPRYTRSADLLLAAGLYGLAKLCELLDAPIHSLGELVSGHTLKHLLAGAAAWTVLAMVRGRRPIDATDFRPIPVPPAPERV